MINNTIKKIKFFLNDNRTANGWNKDLSVKYASINNRWYNYSDLEVVVGVVPGENGFVLDNIKEKHLQRFTEEESAMGFYSI